MTLLARPAILAAALAYTLLVLAIGIWAARRTRTESDFFVAGRRVGLLVAGLATMATAFSGFVFVGGPGLTYRSGLASLWIILPIGITAPLLCWTVGRPLAALAAAGDVLTVPDALAARWPDARVRGLAAVAIATGSTLYLATQLLALGVLLGALLGTSVPLAVLLGALVLLAYSVTGGMVAGIYTDVAQGAIMLVAALATCVQAARLAGGPSAMLATITRATDFGPSFLDPLGRIEPQMAFSLYLVFGIGVLGQPHLAHKFLMLRDRETLTWLPAVLGTSQVLCLVVWVGVGLAVPALVAAGTMAPLARPDDAALALLLALGSDALAGLFVSGVLAAIMSTASSIMSVGGAALARDLPRALGRPAPAGLAAARWAVVLVTLAASGLALAHNDLIALLGTQAFGVFGATLAPVLALGLAWRRVPARAAAASMATGLVLSVLLELVSRRDTSWPDLAWAPGLPPSVIALAASFVVLVVVTQSTTLRLVSADRQSNR